MIPTVIAFAALVFFLGQMVLRSHRNPPVSGREGLIGQVATARTDFAAGGTGTVFVHGEYWNAVAGSRSSISMGSR